MGGSGLSVPFWGICVHCCDSRGSCERPWGLAGVYTDRRKRPLGAVLGHLCTLLRRELYDANYVGWYEHLNHHGVPVAPPSLVASPLVGKTGSTRVAPPLGWHLRRGSNPHKSPMGLGAQGYTKDERAVHRAKAPSLWICSPDVPVTLLPFKVGRDRPDSGVESR